MKALLHILDSVLQFQQLLDALDAGRSPAAVSGLAPVHRAHFTAGIRRRLDCPVVLVCADEEEGRRLAGDLTAFTGEEVTLLAAREFLFHDGAVASRQWEHQRLAAFSRMARGEAPLVVATVEALLQRTLSPQELADHTVIVEAGKPYDLEALADQLAALGYTRCDQVEGVGQFALRGGILDVYSPAQYHPARIEFWDTEVDSMGQPAAGGPAGPGGVPPGERGAAHPGRKRPVTAHPRPAAPHPLPNPDHRRPSSAPGCGGVLLRIRPGGRAGQNLAVAAE